MEKRFVYADNAATTPLSEIAFNAMKPWLTEHYGNPSSLYRMGREAKEAINEARKVVGKCLNAAMPVNEKNDYAPGEILFTGGGSQADNLAIRGFMHGPSSKGRKHIITSKIEHHAVLYTCEALEKEGYRVTYLNVDKEGHVDLEQLKNELSEDTALVSVMAANNEIGTIQPLKQISELAHSVGAKFHTDAVQAVGHMHIDVQEMGIDMLSLAGHKFRGPRGTGVLYVKNGIQLEPLVYGGGQERGLVSGTENTAGFIGLAAAMQDACEHLDEKMGYVKKLTDKLVKGIMENIPYSHYTGDPVNRLPGTASFVFEAIEGEGLILRLDNAGVCGSTGSACSTGSLRLSLSDYNTEEDVDYVIETVTDVVKTLRSMSPVWENGKPNLTAATELHAH